MEIISWNPNTKTFFFKKNNTLYKAKIIDQDQEKNILYIYIFNTNEITTIPLSLFTHSPKTQESLQKQTSITSPLSGRIIKIHVLSNTRIKKNQPLITIESMKMENEIQAPCNLFVKSIYITHGDLVKQDQMLMEIQIDE